VYQKLGNYFSLTVFVDSSLMQRFYIYNNATLGLWMLSFGSVLNFCDSTYWPLIIDVRMYICMYQRPIYAVTKGQQISER
jgi:hypothetical protein